MYIQQFHKIHLKHFLLIYIHIYQYNKLLYHIINCSKIKIYMKIEIKVEMEMEMEMEMRVNNNKNIRNIKYNNMLM